MLLFYFIVVVLVFACLIGYEKPHNTINLTTTEWVILTLFFSLLSPVIIVIIILGLPFYYIHEMFTHDLPKSEPDDDEPQGFNYGDHEDWCDGSEEYDD